MRFPCLAASWAIDRLRGVVAGHARAAETSGYRSGPEIQKAWFEAALAGDDVAFWGAALTLARAEMARTADRVEIAVLAGFHEALWKRLSTRLADAQAVPGVSILQSATPIPGKPFFERPSVVTGSTVATAGIIVAVAVGLALAAYNASNR